MIHIQPEEEYETRVVKNEKLQQIQEKAKKDAERIIRERREKRKQLLAKRVQQNKEIKESITQAKLLLDNFNALLKKTKELQIKNKDKKEVKIEIENEGKKEVKVEIENEGKKEVEDDGSLIKAAGNMALKIASNYFLSFAVSTAAIGVLGPIGGTVLGLGISVPAKMMTNIAIDAALPKNIPNFENRVKKLVEKLPKFLRTERTKKVVGKAWDNIKGIVATNSAIGAISALSNMMITALLNPTEGVLQIVNDVAFAKCVQYISERIGWNTIGGTVGKKIHEYLKNKKEFNQKVVPKQLREYIQSLMSKEKTKAWIETTYAELVGSLSKEYIDIAAGKVQKNIAVAGYDAMGIAGAQIGQLYQNAADYGVVATWDALAASSKSAYDAMRDSLYSTSVSVTQGAQNAINKGYEAVFGEKIYRDPQELMKRAQERLERRMIEQEAMLKDIEQQRVQEFDRVFNSKIDLEQLHKAQQTIEQLELLNETETLTELQREELNTALQQKNDILSDLQTQQNVNQVVDEKYLDEATKKYIEGVSFGALLPSVAPGLTRLARKGKFAQKMAKIGAFGVMGGKDAVENIMITETKWIVDEGLGRVLGPLAAKIYWATVAMKSSIRFAGNVISYKTGDRFYGGTILRFVSEVFGGIDAIYSKALNIPEVEVKKLITDFIINKYIRLVPKTNAELAADATNTILMGHQFEGDKNELRKYLENGIETLFTTVANNLNTTE
jgi:hypothetical protein